MRLRHEVKFRVNEMECAVMASRLRTVCTRDAHGDARGRYRVRSLYFDSYTDKALREKVDGVRAREKFRIRLYNGDRSFVRLEKKGKENGLCYKIGTRVLERECEQLLKGEWSWLEGDRRGLLWELRAKTVYERLRPTVVIEYEREAFCLPWGNVRVTFDRDIRTSVYGTGVFDEGLALVSVKETAMVMEVKYDAFLPDVVRDLLRGCDRLPEAFSKYGIGRMYC